MLSRDQILSKRDLPRETVEVPEWGGQVIVSVMSGFERDAWEKEISDAFRSRSVKNVRAALVARTAIDESGSRIFTDADVEELGKLNWLALERVTAVAQRLNRLTDAAMEEVKGNS